MTEEKANQIIRCVKECWWRLTVFCIALLAFSVLLIHGWPAFEFKDSVAAWFQAIGAIAAIFTAYFVSRFSAKSARALQVEKEQKERVRIENGYKDVVLSLAAEGMAITQEITTKPEKRFRAAWDNFIEQRVATRLKTFSTIPLYDFGNTERIMRTVEIEGEIRWLVGEIESYLEAENKETGFRILKEVVAVSVEERISAAMQKLLATFPND